MKHLLSLFFGTVLTFYSLFISGCSPYTEQSDDSETPDTVSVNINNEVSAKNDIITAAFLEQKKSMYSPSDDTTYLYWLNNYPLIIKNTSKCNIFVLNTLFVAGYKTPKVNALSRDLYNDELFQDFMPIVKLNSLKDILTGDLIVWKSHVIIFESLVYVKEKPYAKGIWAGTSQSDNGDNIINNVIYGKFPLKGDFKVRRPQKDVK